MQILSQKKLIYLGPSKNLPTYLQSVENVLWIQPQSLEELKSLPLKTKEQYFIVVHSKEVNVRTVQAFLSWSKFQPQLQIIFIGQKVEKATHQLALSNSQVLIVFESEGRRIADIVTRCINGLSVKSRKRERSPLRSLALVQGSSLGVGRLTKSQQAVMEGVMTDFSRGGAQISLQSAGLNPKEFVSVLYRDERGKWVSVESQVRWVLESAAGVQTVGVQFLAVSA